MQRQAEPPRDQMIWRIGGWRLTIMGSFVLLGIIALVGYAIINASRPASNIPSASLPYSDSLRGAVDARGWPVTDQCRSGSDGYHIVSNVICVAPLGTVRDCTVSVTVKRVSGNTSDYYGIALRADKLSRAYIVAIDSSGHLYFAKQDPAGQTPASEWNSSAIVQGLQVENSIRVMARGSHFTLSINSVKLAEFDDSAYTTGEVGLFGPSSGDVAFTDLSVIAA